MNITIFIGGLSGGGAERVACNLANHLSENNQVTLLTLSDAPASYEIDPRVSRVSLLKSEERGNAIRNFIRRYQNLKAYISSGQTDAYIVMLPITISLLLHFRKRISVPIIAAERCNPPTYPLSRKLLMKWYAQKADGWVFQTADAMKWYDGRIKKGVVIPNAINPAFLREVYTGEPEKTVVAAGRLAEQKNFSMLIEAFSRIADRHPEHRLVIYGKGPQEASLKEKAAALGLADRVDFPGYVDNMPEQLEKAGLFVLSSDFEGMPNALMEAMALGLPCVSTDCPCGGPAFLVDPGKNGLLVPVGDADATARAMDELLGDPEKARAMGQSARKLADTLEPTAIYGRWEALVRELAGP